MCERDDDKCSSGCCSECDFDEWVDYTLGSTSDEEEGEERGEEGEEATDNATDATDAREISKFEEKEKDKKENCGHYISGCKIIAKCCDREFGCRICHDFEVSEHEINRYEI